MHKRKTLFVITITSTLVLGSSIALASYNFSKNIQALGNENLFWKHYAEVLPTDDKHGSKEFWANCSESSLGTHVLERPSSGTIIENGVDEKGFDFSETIYFDDLDMFDDRYIFSKSFSGEQINELTWTNQFDNTNFLTGTNAIIKSTYHIEGEEHIRTLFLDEGKTKAILPSDLYPVYAQYSKNGNQVNYTLWQNEVDEYNELIGRTPINGSIENGISGVSLYLGNFGIIRELNFEDYKNTYQYNNGVYESKQSFLVDTLDGTLNCLKCFISISNNKIKNIAYLIDYYEATFSGIENYSDYGTIDLKEEFNNL